MTCFLFPDYDYGDYYGYGDYRGGYSGAEYYDDYYGYDDYDYGYGGAPYPQRGGGGGGRGRGGPPHPPPVGDSLFQFSLPKNDCYCQTGV